MIALLAQHPNGSFSDFRAVVSFVFHGPILSNDGVSGKTEAVHRFLLGRDKVIFIEDFSKNSFLI